MGKPNEYSVANRITASLDDTDRIPCLVETLY